MTKKTFPAQFTEADVHKWLGKKLAAECHLCIMENSGDTFRDAIRVTPDYEWKIGGGTYCARTSYGMERVRIVDGFLPHTTN